MGIEGITFATIIWKKEALWSNSRHGNKRFAVSFEFSMCHISRMSVLIYFFCTFVKSGYVGVRMRNLYVF